MDTLRPISAPDGGGIRATSSSPSLPPILAAEAERVLSALIGASPMAIVAYDPEGTVTLWSPAAERMFGWSAEEAVGRGLPFVPADRQEEFRGMRQRAVRGESFTTPELHRRRADGSPIVVSAVTVPLRREGGTVNGILSILSEVADRDETVTPPVLRMVADGGHAEWPRPVDAPGGTETVLLVDDVETVRALAREILRMNGYTVLEARHAREALLLSEAHRGPIHLMLTDVMMPGMSGGELARRMRAQRPSTRVLYMSGYADAAIFPHALPGGDTAFLQKPFTAAALSRKVRDTLDAP
jgi:PAS domain S-box-containing protein